MRLFIWDKKQTSRHAFSLRKCQEKIVYKREKRLELGERRRTSMAMARTCKALANPSRHTDGQMDIETNHGIFCVFDKKSQGSQVGGNRQHFRLHPVQPMRSAKICPPPHLVPKSRGVSSQRYFDDVIPMGESEVRDALMAEAKRHRLWKSAVIKKMEFERLEMLSCLQYRLESFTEARSTTETTEAVNPAALLENGYSSADPWDYEVLPDNMFLDQVRVLEMPGTSQINGCSTCNSEGVAHCFHCRGYGTDKCNFCRGTGMKAGVAHPAVYTHPMVATFPHADLSRGYASSSTAMIRHGSQTAYGLGTPMHFMSKTGVPPPGIGTHDLCYMCHGRGIKECHHCKGGGKKPCTTCNGTGSTRTFTKLKVYFRVERSEYLGESEVPQRLLAVAGGKEIFSEEQAYVLPISRYPVKEINDQSKLFCAQHLQKCMGVSRVIKQRHSLTAIPICKVHFSVGNSKGIFYVYGNSRQCYVPNFPAKCTIL